MWDPFVEAIINAGPLLSDKNNLKFKGRVMYWFQCIYRWGECNVPKSLFDAMTTLKLSKSGFAGEDKK